MANISLKSLHFKHPRLHYEAYDPVVTSNLLTISYHFLLEPDIHFYPQISLPLPKNYKLNASLDNLIFHLGLIELLSYWKAACPPEIIIKAGYLNEDQIHWWQDLFLYGLGEFYYRNQIDFTPKDFLTIKSPIASPKLSSKGGKALPSVASDLILVGGGKDSALTLDLLSNQPNRHQVLLLNPTPAALGTAKIAGFNDPLIVTRQIDPTLLQLNAAGYLNGHTPFSAYLAFVSLLAAQIHGFAQVITSNEASAGEASLQYLNLPINHQYSKSFAYEQKFHQYASTYLSPVNFFSFLRPLTELQIAALYAKTSRFDQAISSCNVTRNVGWCRECPKCAFVYLVLSAFLDQNRLQKIFGSSDFFDHPSIINHLIDLVGLGQHKPFDCVGTIQDSQDALLLSLARYPHPALEKLALRLNLDPATTPTINAQIKNHLNDQHFLPPSYLKIVTLGLKSL